MLQRNVAIVEEKHKWAIRMPRPRLGMQLAIVLVTRGRRNASHIQRKVAIQIEIVLIDVKKPETGLGSHTRAVILEGLRPAAATDNNGKWASAEVLAQVIQRPL